MGEERNIVGAFPTMITPFKEDGSVDYETVKKYVHWYHDSGYSGIFAVCQSSEIFFLSVEERERAELQEHAVAMAREHPEDVAMLIRTWLMEE